MKMFKRLCVLLTIIFTLGAICPEASIFITNQQTVEAATVKISKKKVSLTKWQKTVLSVKGTKKKAKWSSSNKNVAAVSGNGTVTAKKKGRAVITAKIGSKKYKCTVTVKNPKQCGENAFYVTTPGGTTKNKKIPSFKGSNYYLLQIGYDTGWLNKPNSSKIYVNNKLVSETGYSYKSQGSISLSGNALKKGLYTVEFVQYKSTTKNFQIYNYKRVQYRIK